MEEGSEKSCKETHKTTKCMPQDVSEANVSSQSTQLSLGRVKHEDLDQSRTQRAADSRGLLGQSTSFSFSAVNAESRSYTAQTSDRTFQGSDFFLSKTCEEDSDVQSDSSLASPLPGYSDYFSDTQTEFSHPSQVAERPSASYSSLLSYGSGINPYPLKRGRGRPRKDPFSLAIRRPRGRGFGRRGRPSLSHSPHRQAWLHPRQGQRSMDASDRVDSEDGLAVSRAFVPSDGPSTSGSDQTLAGSAMASAVDEMSDTPGSGRICAFCACGEKSLLGQGDLCKFEATLGFTPTKKVLKSQRGTCETEEQSREKSPKHLTWRRPRGPFKGSRERSRSPRQQSFGEEETAVLSLTDELTLVGYTDDVEISAVFDEMGAVWAHECCAMWSEHGENTGAMLQFVDRAAFHGLSQKCGYCRRYGASLACRSPGCTKKYHFPCASAGNCFQDLKTLSLLCPDHVEQAEVIAGNDAYCIQCSELGNVSEQLFCTSCGQHYHGNCLRPSVEIKPIVRAGWQCPNCKICQTCRNPGDDNKMLVCDTCDKGYHTFCLRPAMTTIPKNGWKCKNCRICSDCGARTPGNGPSSRWHLNYSVCDSCYQQRNKGLCCPLCGKAYRHFQNKNMMVPCSSCKKHVHSECDPAIDSALLQRVRQGEMVDYTCQVCRETSSVMEIEPYVLTAPSGTDESMESFPLSKADSEVSLKDSTMMTEHSLATMSSQESLYCEDSNSSADYDTDKTYVPHRDDMHGHKLLLSRKKIGTTRTRSRGLVVSEKRYHGPLSLREKGRRPKMRAKMSPAESLAVISAPATPVPVVPQAMEVLPSAAVAVPGEATGSPSPSTPQPQDPASAEKKEKDDDDDGDDHPVSVILAQSADTFVMDRDVCKSCGSFGLGDESKMIVCSQCGQCYHPFCVTVKVTRVILKKGWRCLDCTVCEGCGGREDEGRLLLCDDCDISYHTYCLQPPLTQVPKGNWKCKWCVRCLYCGSTSPGLGCHWMSNYTKCGPCHSKLSCPVCCRHYREEELIIQCVHCDRWLHCMCDGLRNEDEAELAADYGYHCLYCRPKTGKHGPLPPPPPPPPPPPVEEEVRLASPPASVFMEPETPRQYLLDGVYLLANGMQQIQSQIIPLPRIKRQRRQPKIPFGARTPRMFGLDGEDSFDKDDEMKMLEGLEPGELPSGVIGSDLTPEEEAKLAKIKRQRKQLGMGVGGFMIRQMTRKLTKRQTSVEEHVDEAIGPGEGDLSLLQEKPKKKTRKSRKGKLEESFPAYLQEAFFGVDLINSCKFTATASQDMLHSGSDSDDAHHSPSQPPSPPTVPCTSTGVGPSGLGLGPEGEVKGISVDSVGEIVAGSGEQRQTTPLSNSQQGSESNELDEGDTDFLLGKDILKLFDMDPDLESGTEGSKDKSEELSEKEGDQDNLEKILDSRNIDVDRMLSEGLVHFEGVDDIFTGVLKPEEETQPQQVTGGEQVPFPMHPVAGPSHSNMPTHPVPMTAVRVGTQDHMMPPPHRVPPEEPPTQEIPPFSIPPMFPPVGEQMSPDMGPGMSQTVPPWATGPAGEEEETTIGSNKRSILKWETDEALGINATISAVLYVNINFPNLRKDYPEWTERAKQIAKLWRKLKPEEKAPYLSKARKNRTSHRVQKAQKQQVSQELKLRREAQMIHDSEAMPPPPAPPPLPGQLPGVGDPFAQPPGPHDPPEALSPSMRNTLQSPGGPVSSPFHRWSEDPFHKSPTMDTSPDSFPSPGAVPRQGAGAQTHESFPFSPGTPKHDPYAVSPGTPRPRLQHQSFEQFVRGPGPQGASPVTSPLPPDDPYSKAPLTPRMFGAHHGSLSRPKLEEHQGSSQPPHDPYAFPPTTPRAATPQDDGYHAALRLPHSAPDSFPGTAATMQAGLGPRPGSEPGDMFHGLPPSGMADTFGSPSASSSAHASPVHSMPSTPPRPSQYALSPGGGMTSPLRHPDSGPLLQRSNSMPHSYPGAPPRLPVDPTMSRSMSEVSQDSLQHFSHRMPPPQDPALISRRLKLGPHGPPPWPYSVAPPGVGPGGTGEATLGSLGQGVGGTATTHQQLREILGQQTKLRMQQKAAQQLVPGHPMHSQWLQQQQQHESGMAPGTAGIPPSSMMPRMPGSLPVFRDGRPVQPGMPPERWPMVRPTHPAHFPQEVAEGFSPRGQPGEAGAMRFSVPQTMAQPQGPPGTAAMLSPGMTRPPSDAFQQTQQQGVAGMLPALSRPADDEVFQQLDGQRSQLLAHATTKGEEGGGEAGGSQGREEAVEGDGLQLPVDKDLKPSISSEDDKPEDYDLLSADGTFDILKYADPELDLDDPNLIDSLDLMDDPKASSGEGEGEDKKDEEDDKSDDKKALESAVEGAVKGDLDGDEGSEDSTKIKDFQAQFLEFSQRRQHQLDTADSSTTTQTGDGDKGVDSDDKAGVSHIAALLQGTKPISTGPGRGIVDGSVEGGKLAEAEASLVSGTIQTMLQRPPFAQGLPVSLAGQTPGAQQSSPQSVGPSGLPSPKVSHSPRSGQPSPRTPGIQSPYSQMLAGQQQQHSVSPHSQPLTPAGQMSPFSQHGSGQSPFSPTIPSAQSPFGLAAGTPASTPQSPYALQGPSRTISPFTMAVSTGQVASSQTGPLQHLPHAQPPPQQMMASRATITPTNQYNQGSYSQPLGALGPPPRGGTLTPTPSSILYGQSAATQHALRPQGPRPFPPGQELGGDGVEMGDQRLSHPVLTQQMLQQARFPGGPPISHGAVLRGPLPPTSSHPSLQHQLAQGQRPPFPPSHRLLSPGLRPTPGPPGVAGIRMSPASATEQKTLLDELLEQEKQEQKKQAEQQAMLHRPGQPPEGVMAGGPRPGMMPQQHPGMPPHGMPPRMVGPDGGWAGGPRPGPTGELGPGQQFPPGFIPRMPGQPMGAHGPMPPFPPPQLQPPQTQAGAPILPPPPQQVPVPAAELAPSAEYDRQVLQYEDWLSKQTQYLDLHVKMLEHQIQKQKRVKKSIQARQRQARKNNQELNPKDTLELERVAAEQSEIQKQLEAQRKQSRQHQVVVQDYYNKQKEQFGSSWPAGVPAPPSGPMGSVSNPQSTATSTSTAVMLQPRLPGSPSSIRMSPTARQEYDAYMQSRLRLAAQSPRPRAPTTIQLGDNNPFSETFQVREQLLKKQGVMPASPSETTTAAASPGSQQPAGPPTPTPGPTAGPPGPVAAVRPPSLPPTGEGMGPVQQFFRERNPETGQRFIRPPGPYGDGNPRVEGPRLPPYPGPSHPGMHMESTRVPFPQGMPMQPGPGFAPPGMSLPPGSAGDMGVGSTQTPTKEKPKKRRKKKKVEDSDGAQSQPLPPSMPSQSMMSSSTQQTDSRPAASGPGLPKPPEFKPQSETERRILEILSNTAALASKEGSQPPAKGGNTKGARSKSPAAATATHKSVAAEKSLDSEQTSSEMSGDSSRRPVDSGSSQMGSQPSHQMPTASSAGVQTTTSIPGTLPGEPGHPAGYPARLPHMPPGPHPGFPPQGMHHLGPGHPMMTAGGAPPRQGMPPVSVNLPMGSRPGMPPHPRHLPPRGAPFHPRLPPTMQQLQDAQRLPQHLMHLPPGVSISMAQQHPNINIRPSLPSMSGLSDNKPNEGGTVVPGSGPAPSTAKPEDTPHIQRGTPPASQLSLPVEALPVSTSASQEPLPPPPPQLPVSEVPSSSTSLPSVSSVSMTAEGNSVQKSTQREAKGATDSSSGQDAKKKAGTDSENKSEKKVCDDGIHCGTDDEEEKPKKKVCDDGIHCGTDDEEEQPKKKVCDDGIHCGTDDEEEKPKNTVCDDGIHCGTDDEDEKPKKKVCDDGIHCGTDDEDEKPKKKVCDDGIHCGTDDEDEKPKKKVCDDGIHCGTDDEDEKPKKKVCDDGIHCGTDDEDEKPKKKVCDDGIHCGTDDEDEKPKKKVCDDGIHCGTDDEDEKPKKKVCDDGIHCGTDDEDEKPKKKVCDDGIHCGTDDEDEKPKKKVCDDGIHCGTDDEEEKPKKKVCDDGIHCGTDDEDEKPKKKVCDDGIHCGTDDEEEKPKKKVCDDGIHCGTDDEDEKPKKKVCDDGIHCGTDDEDEKPKKKVCDDGIHCGTDDEEEKPKKKVCDDGIHCGTDDEDETGKESAEPKGDTAAATTSQALTVLTTAVSTTLSEPTGELVSTTSEEAMEVDMPPQGTSSEQPTPSEGLTSGIGEVTVPSTSVTKGHSRNNGCGPNQLSQISTPVESEGQPIVSMDTTDPACTAVPKAAASSLPETMSTAPQTTPGTVQPSTVPVTTSVSISPTAASLVVSNPVPDTVDRKDVPMEVEQVDGAETKAASVFVSGNTRWDVPPADSNFSSEKTLGVSALQTSKAPSVQGQFTAAESVHLAEKSSAEKVECLQTASEALPAQSVTSSKLGQTHSPPQVVTAEAQSVVQAPAILTTQAGGPSPAAKSLDSAPPAPDTTVALDSQGSETATTTATSSMAVTVLSGAASSSPPADVNLTSSSIPIPAHHAAPIVTTSNKLPQGRGVVSEAGPLPSVSAPSVVAAPTPVPVSGLAPHVGVTGAPSPANPVSTQTQHTAAVQSTPHSSPPVPALTTVTAQSVTTVSTHPLTSVPASTPSVTVSVQPATAVSVHSVTAASATALSTQSVTTVSTQPVTSVSTLSVTPVSTQSVMAQSATASFTTASTISTVPSEGPSVSSVCTSLSVQTVEAGPSLHAPHGDVTSSVPGVGVSQSTVVVTPAVTASLSSRLGVGKAVSSPPAEVTRVPGITTTSGLHPASVASTLPPTVSAPHTSLGAGPSSSSVSQPATAASHPPGVTVPRMSTPGMAAPGMTTPAMTTPGMTAQSVTTAGVTTAGLTTPDISTTSSMTTPSMTASGLPNEDHTVSTAATTASTSVSLPLSRPVLPPLSMGGHPSDHLRAGQPRSPLDMLARVSHSALSSAGSALPTSLPSPPATGAQLSPDMLRGGFPRHPGPPMSQHLTHHGPSTAPTPTSQHSPTLAQAGDGTYMPRHMFPGPGMPKFRSMVPPGEYPQGRGMMSPPAMSPTSPSQRGQRPQFPPYHGADVMHPGMSPRAMGPRPMLPPDVMSRTSPNADAHMGMMPPHMSGYGHPPPHSQAMMNRPPYNLHPPHSSGVDFPPWSHHPGMSMAPFPGHRMPAGGPPSAPQSPSSTSPLRLQNVGPGFPKDPRMMIPENHPLGQGDPRMASLRMFAEQQRMGMIRQRHPMMPPGAGAAAFPPHQHPPQPRLPMFPEEGMDPFHPLHNHPVSTPPSVSEAAHMAISQAMSPMGPGAPRPPFPEAVSLAPSSSLASMMSSAGGPVNTAAMETGVKGLDIVVNQGGLPGAMLVKTEPGVEAADLGVGAGRDMDLEQRAKHNALLKQLLSREQAIRAEAHPPSTPDSEESLPQLTPEQQRQLELIDMMPLCKETEASTDLPDWDNKTAEEKEQLLELRKQEYEKKRKQYEAVRKKRKNQTPGVGPESAGIPQPKIKKRRPKSLTTSVDATSLASTDLSVSSEPASKKRSRRNKNRESRMEQRESELEFMAETFLQQLHSLPSVPLQEPDMALLYTIVPIKGAANVTGVGSLRGTFSQGYLDKDFDVYGSLCFPPPPPSLQPVAPSVASSSGVFGEERKHTPDIVTCVAAASSPVVTAPVVSSPIVTMPVSIPTEAGPFALPAHPRIEVKTEPLRDTPDTIISSSSPECGFMEKESEYSSLRLIEPASPGCAVDDKYSPTVPLLHPIPIYPKVEKEEGREVKPSIVSPNLHPSLGPPVASQTASSQTVSPAHPPSSLMPLSSKQETGMVTHADMGTQAEAGSQDLTIKLPTMTSGLVQPFVDPSQDQKVSVTLTLSANATEDIGGVISAIADLLKIAVPPTYEITRTPSPEMFKMNLTHKEDVINIQALMHTKPAFCGHCHVVLINSGIRKHKSELPPALVPDDLDPGEEEVTWCSMNCMNQFLQTGPYLEELDEDDEGQDEDNSNTSTIIMDQDDQQQAEDQKMEVDADPGRSQLCLVPSPKTSSLPFTEALSISTSSPALSASASATTQPGTPTTPTAGPSSFSSPAASPAHSLMSPGARSGGPLGSPHHPMLSPSLRGKEERAIKRHRRSSSTTSQEGYLKPAVKRWRDERWKRWDISMSLTKLPDVPAKELNELWEALVRPLHSATMCTDPRPCALCLRIGDGDPDGPSRLLNYDVDKWVHLNCALWSLEVYETLNGALMNVETAMSRGLTTECVVCRRMGATLGCFKNRCTNSYHLPCARSKGCFFFQDKTIICSNHNNTPRPYPDAELLSLEVRRRVYINRDEERQVASMVSSLIHPDEGRYALRIGSLILHCIGQLLPHQIQTNKFNTDEFIYPVGYRTTRFYWSHRSLYKRCRYLCSIADKQGAPEFIVCVKEEGHSDVTFRDSSAKGVWMNIIRPLKDMHSSADMVKMFPEFMCMEDLFGLREPAIVRILESLPGADLLHNYTFKYGRSPLIEMPPAINPTGCARTEPKLRTHFRRPHTLHSSQSRSLPSSVTGVTGDMNSPYMKQFVHSKSQQYRRLKTEWKNLVYLGKSRIQGLGLYAAKDLEKHTMVIEYIGDLIRNEVANRREKEYDDQNRGVYMFRIDNDTVIDATMAGGPARYINHSCSPNCVAEVVHFEKESKIIIITSRRIQKGEELTYDYKFDFEDDQHKIPCLCGATGCRKWMN